jgi:hypothetical protein
MNLELDSENIPKAPDSENAAAMATSVAIMSGMRPNA